MASFESDARIAEMLPLFDADEFSVEDSLDQCWTEIEEWFSTFATDLTVSTANVAPQKIQNSIAKDEKVASSHGAETENVDQTTSSLQFAEIVFGGRAQETENQLRHGVEASGNISNTLSTYAKVASSDNVETDDATSSSRDSHITDVESSAESLPRQSGRKRKAEDSNAVNGQKLTKEQLAWLRVLSHTFKFITDAFNRADWTYLGRVIDLVSNDDCIMITSGGVRVEGKESMRRVIERLVAASPDTIMVSSQPSKVLFF